MSKKLRTLKKGAKGKAVEDLQLKLSGFRGTVWDGDFGPGTELQVVSFQKEYMGLRKPSGQADINTLHAIEEFTNTHLFDFDRLYCPCMRCNGFGERRYKNKYRTDRPKSEAYHKYEYPGVHKAIIFSYMAAVFWGNLNDLGSLMITSGYRCWTNNKQKNRWSTNHMGKAIDFDIQLNTGEDKRSDMENCERMRGILVENAYFQIGWTAYNRKSIEPSHIAPTWIHIDVRSYAKKYLNERFFVKKEKQLIA